MSNFHPTVGRNVQYIDANGNINAAIITLVAGPVVDLIVFPYRDGQGFHLKNVKPYIVGERNQTSVYLLNWQGR